MTKIETKKVTKKKSTHRHRWERNYDSCWVCGSSEAYCKSCDMVGIFDLKGKLIDTTS